MSDAATPAPAGRTECEPELASPPTPSLFRLRNRRRPLHNFINAEVTPTGLFHYHVGNLPPDGLGCPGAWLFEEAWSYFAGRGVPIRGVLEEWFYGDNLATVNALTANSRMTLEQAARDPSLWAYQRASSKGYTDVTILAATGTPGRYTSIDVLYTL